MTTITVNGQTVDLNTFDLDDTFDLDALRELAEQAEKVVAQREIKVLTMYLDEVKPQIKPAENAARVGAYRSTEFRHNGRLLKVTVNVTDVEATKAREPQFPKKEKASKADSEK